MAMALFQPPKLPSVPPYSYGSPQVKEKEMSHRRQGLTKYMFGIDVRIIGCFRTQQIQLKSSRLNQQTAFNRAGNEQCLLFWEHVFVFVVLFSVWFLNVSRVVFNVFGVYSETGAEWRGDHA